MDNQNDTICQECGKNFNNTINFHKHYRQYHKKAESNCNICERRFHTVYLLRQHGINVHTIEKCNICGAGMAKGVLARHRKRHMDIKFNCEKCDNIFTRKDSLKKHELICGKEVVKVHKTPAVMVFNCDSCGKTFKKKRYLKQHQRTHVLRITIQKYDCKCCEKIYTSNQSLAKHIEKNHTNPRKVEDKNIGFFVLDSSPLRRVEKTKKVYSCDQCNYVSEQKANLKRHIDTHTSNRVKTGRPRKSPEEWSTVTKRIYARKAKNQFLQNMKESELSEDVDKLLKKESQNHTNHNLKE